MKRIYFYFKGELLIEVERFSNSFLYWVYSYSKQADRKLSQLGYTGSDELSQDEGQDMIKYLKGCKSLTFAEI